MKKVVWALGAALVLIAGSLYVLSRPDPPGEARPASALSPFDEEGRIEPGPFDAAYSPQGSRLAVRSSTGIGIAEAGDVRRFTRSGAQAVDMAWFPGTSKAMLVADAANLFVALGTDGEELGMVRPDPAITLAQGGGLAVTEDRRTALAVTSVRDALGEDTKLDIVAVDLTTNAVRPVAAAPELDESDPHLVAGGRLAHTVAVPGGGASRVVVRSIEGGEPTALSPEGEEARIAGVLAGGTEVVYVVEGDGRSTVWAHPVDGGARRALGAVPSDVEVVAVHPDGGEVVVAGRPQETDGGQEVQLRRIRFEGAGG